MVSREALLIRFPELDKCPETLLAACLEEAHRKIGSDMWGSSYEDGVKIFAARLIAMSPQGKRMQLTTKNGGTIYDPEWKRLQRVVASGCRVI